MYEEFDEEEENAAKKSVVSPLDPLLEKLAIAFVVLVFLAMFVKTVFL